MYNSKTTLFYHNLLKFNKERFCSDTICLKKTSKKGRVSWLYQRPFADSYTVKEGGFWKYCSVREKGNIYFRKPQEQYSRGVLSGFFTGIFCQDFRVFQKKIMTSGAIFWKLSKVRERLLVQIVRTFVPIRCMISKKSHHDFLLFVMTFVPKV